VFLLPFLYKLKVNISRWSFGKLRRELRSASNTYKRDMEDSPQNLWVYKSEDLFTNQDVKMKIPFNCTPAITGGLIHSQKFLYLKGMYPVILVLKSYPKK
jgi:hypothetical protein